MAVEMSLVESWKKAQEANKRRKEAIKKSAARFGENEKMLRAMSTRLRASNSALNQVLDNQKAKRRAQWRANSQAKKGKWQ